MSRPEETPQRAAATVAWIAIVLGAAVRAWALSRRGSLWLDEAALALNVMTRTFSGLAHPLDWGQAAPVGFLWLERALAWHAEVPDTWLRIVPFVAGAALPWLMWLLGRRVLGTAAGALGAVVAAGSMLALRYSTEAKPYASDAAVAAALMVLATAAIDEPHRMRRWWMLAAGVVLGVLLSLPAVFVVAAAAAALAWEPAVRSARGARAVAAPSVAIAALVFVALWFSSYHAGATDTSLRAYWAPVMLDFAADDRVVRVVRVLMELTWIPLRWTGSLLGTAAGSVLWIAGVTVVAQRRRSHAVLLAGPVLIAMAASMAGKYPLSDRLAFFAVPGVWMAQAAALVRVRNTLLSNRSVLANARVAAVFVVVVSACLALWQATDSERFLRDPGALEPTRQLFASIDIDAATAPVYVFARSAPAWIMATHEGPWVGDAQLNRWTALAGADGAPGSENAARSRAVRPGEGDSLVVHTTARTELVGLAPGISYHIAGAPSAGQPSPGWAGEEARRLAAAAQPTVWLVASHFFANSPRNELRPLLEAAAAAGLRVAEERHAGSDVIAVRLTR